LQNYQGVRMWHWCLSPLGSLLNHAHLATGTCVALLTTSRRTHMTFSLTIPTNQDFIRPPVTPSDKFQRTVALPVLGIEYRLPLTPIHSHHCSLITQFRMTLAIWQKPMCGPICQLQPTPSLLLANHARGIISLISDASVQKSKQSGFAWILAHGTSPLWQGVGLAPGPAGDIFSCQAEAFGLLAGLTFLRHYIQCYEPQ